MIVQICGVVFVSRVLGKHIFDEEAIVISMFLIWRC